MKTTGKVAKRRPSNKKTSTKRAPSRRKAAAPKTLSETIRTNLLAFGQRMMKGLPRWIR